MMEPQLTPLQDEIDSIELINSVRELMKELVDVVVVAPDGPQSGMGHAITIGNTLRLEATDIFGDIKAYECSGTPADCVK